MVEDGDHIFAGETYAEIEVTEYTVDRILTYAICAGSFCLLVLYYSGDEDGDDIDCAAVWLYPLCQATRSGSGAWLCGGTYGSG